MPRGAPNPKGTVNSLAKLLKLSPGVSQSGVRFEHKPLAMHRDPSGVWAHIEESVFCDLGWIRDGLGVRKDSGDVVHPSSGEVERIDDGGPKLLETADSILFVDLLRSLETRDFSLLLLKHFKVRPSKPENRGGRGNEKRLP